MYFLAPQFLWLLPIVPGLVLLYLWLLGRRKKLAVRYASLAIVKQAMTAGMGWRRHLPPALILVAIGLGLLAASRPLARITLPTSSVTIMLAMDVSLSMRATDVKPNRLVAAQEAAKAFLAELPHHIKVGIVTFAGTAQLVQPPTLNREDLVAAIDRFQMQRGTAVGSAIVVALSTLFPDEGIDLGEMTFGSAPQGKSLDSKNKKVKKEVAPVAPGSYESAAIILLTDGRRTTGIDTEEAAKMAADHGVRVYAVGLGTVDGAVPAYDSWTAIYMKLDEPSLRAVAQKTQAEYYYAGDAEALKNVYAKLSSSVKVENKETELSALLALLAACLCVAAATLSLRWFSRIA
ncbi:MAG: VWA domain-containing protein [Comamonadaceae bacterium]|nr:VWA domain-containing protein [Comamonadaceae bacterium]